MPRVSMPSPCARGQTGALESCAWQSAAWVLRSRVVRALCSLGLCSLGARVVLALLVDVRVF